MTLPKRSIKEWLVVARVNDSVRTIFFEGPSDARIITAAGGFIENADFRSAEEIEDDVESTPLRGGHKAKIIALADAVDLNGAQDKIQCLADSDFSYYVSDVARAKSLSYTDYANLIVGWFSRDWLRGFFLRGYGIAISEAEYREICGDLRFSFIARYLSAISGNRISAPALSEFLIREDRRVKFEKSDYVKRYFGLFGKDILEKVNEIEEIAIWRAPDIRHCINSSDLFEYVYGFLRKKNGIKGGVSKDAIRSAILSAIDLDLKEQPAVKILLDWISESM